MQLAIDVFPPPLLLRITKLEVELDKHERRGDLPDKVRLLEYLAIQQLAGVAPSVAGQEYEEILPFFAGLPLSFIEIANPGRAGVRNGGFRSKQ